MPFDDITNAFLHCALEKKTLDYLEFVLHETQYKNNNYNARIIYGEEIPAHYRFVTGCTKAIEFKFRYRTADREGARYVLLDGSSPGLFDEGDEKALLVAYQSGVRPDEIRQRIADALTPEELELRRVC